MYPLKFEPIYKERIWGGRKLETKLGRRLPAGRIGESWELSAHGDDVSRVVNGRFAGQTLAQLTDERRSELFGAAAAAVTDGFPLLIKIIDANDKLSLQVHPGDSATGNGKTEAWYVAAAEPDARIIYGLKPGLDRAALEAAIEEGRVLEAVEYANVKAGDLVFVPAGTVHALMEGVLVYEVQQTSDTTYRLYDYERRQDDGSLRTLHVEPALEVIDFSVRPPSDFERAIECPYFSLRRIQCAGSAAIATEDRFAVVCVTAGEGAIAYSNGLEPVQAGETLLLPASLRQVELRGDFELLLIR